MSPSEGDPRDTRDLPADEVDELEDDDDDIDEEDAPAWWTRIDPRRAAAVGIAALLVVLVAIPIAVITVPAASDSLLLVKNGPDIVLAAEDVPSGLKVVFEGPKSPTLGLDESQASAARKAQLIGLGFGGGWNRNFEGGIEPGVIQVASGASVYTRSEGAHAEYQRTAADYDRDPAWKRFSLGQTVGDEYSAWEQAARGAHGVLIYYRYANVLGQVLVTYAGPADKGFSGAQQSARELAGKQTAKQRGARFRPL